MRPLTPATHPDLLVGNATGDDAAVWRRPDGVALVATVDVFTPIVDDAYLWGRIAATNAVSDVHAMGATPLFALAITAWPTATLPLALLTEVLRGGQDAAEADGYVVVGGHSIDGPEPVYGQAVVGEVHEHALLTHATANVGDLLVLTKPLGTGIITTALKRKNAGMHLTDERFRSAYDAAVKEMTRSNRQAALLAREANASALTDVTGFGLTGHLSGMVKASNVAATLATSAVPLLPHVRALLDEGFVPGGSVRNRDAIASLLKHAPVIDEQLLTVLSDAQTSGGLLISVPAGNADALVNALCQSGHVAATVGEVTGDTVGTITLEP